MEGIEVKLGDEVFCAGPASLKAVKDWMRAQKECRAGSLEFLEAVTAFALASLRRNHPELTGDQLDALLDERNIPTLLDAVNKAGGLEPGEVRKLPTT